MSDAIQDERPDDVPAELPARGFVFGMILKMGAGLLIGLLVADRVVGTLDEERDDRTPGQVMFDAELGWTNTPGFVWNQPDDPDVVSRINAHGLRGPEIPEDAPADELRVLGMGASRVFGSGQWANETVWDHFLQAILDRRVEHPVRVLNGGVKGYSAMQIARRTMRLVPELQPDIVLLFIAAGPQMMLDPSSAQHWVTLDDGRVVPKDIAEALPGPLRPLGVTLHEGLLNFNLYVRYRAQFESAGSRPETLRRFMFLGEPVRPDAAEMFGNTKRELAAVQAFCAERGVELRAVVMPEAFQMNDAKWAEWLRFGETRDVGSPPPDTPRLAAAEALDGLLQELGYATWFLRDELETLGTDVDTYCNDGRHWSGPGHRVIAQGLARRLLEDDLLERLAAERRASPRRP